MEVFNGTRGITSPWPRLVRTFAWRSAGGWLLGVAVGVVCIVPAGAQVPDPLDALRARVEKARTQKDFSRAEVVSMLATTPDAPFSCPVGEVWPAFVSGAPHSAGTVTVMLDLYRKEPELWKRYHLLSALAAEVQPSLRAFWSERFADPKLAVEHRGPVIMGVWKTGSDDGRKKLLARLGSGRQWDTDILTALYFHPQASARTAVAGRFRDRKAPDRTRTFALQVLVEIGGPEARGYLREAAADENAAVRKTATALAQQPVK